MQKNRLPPLSPDKFEVKLRQEKQFTNGKEDFDHVVKIYKKYFDVISGSVKSSCRGLSEACGSAANELRLIKMWKSRSGSCIRPSWQETWLPTQMEQEDRSGELPQWHWT